MTDVFISYSRKDIAFARLLHEALLENELETWIDWQDIPPSADWLAEVYEAIEGADAFVFVISETSLNSEICSLEMNHAAQHNKRLIPIVVKDVEAEQVPKELAVLNWIFFEDAGEKFAEAMENLVTAITVDQDWLKGHTRFENRALAWERKESDRGLLLRGSDLAEAENWLAGSAGKDPQPTALQTQYILKSREDSTRRQRITLGAVGVGLVVAVCLGILAWTQRNIAVTEGFQRATAEALAIAEADARATQQTIAEQQRDIAEEQRDIAVKGLSGKIGVEALSILSQSQSLSLLLSLEALHLADTMEARSSLLSGITKYRKLEKILFSNKNSAECVEYSPDGKVIATCHLKNTEQGSVLLWDAKTGNQISIAGVSGADSTAVVFSPNNQMMAILSSSENTITLWDLETNTLIENLISTPIDITLNSKSIAFHPTENYFAMPYDEGSVQFRDSTTQALIAELYSDQIPDVSALAFSLDGEKLAVGSLHGPIALWELDNLEEPASILEGTDGAYLLTFNPDGEQLAYVSKLDVDWNDSTWNVYDLTTDTIEYFSHCKCIVMDIDFSTDGKYLAVADEGSWLTLDRTQEAGGFVLLQGHQGLQNITSISFSPDGHIAATSNPDTSSSNPIAKNPSAQALIWDLNAEYPIIKSVPYGRIISLEFNPIHENILASASSSTFNIIAFWDTNNGVMIKELNTDSTIKNLAYSPDGKIMAFVSDHSIQLWDAENYRPLTDLVGTGQVTVSSLSFNPDGDLFTGGNDGSIRKWSGKDLNELPFLIFHPSSQEGDTIVEHIDVSPDGNFLASLSGETLAIWNLQSQEPFPQILTSAGDDERFENYYGAWNQVVFHPDGTLLAAARRGGAIDFWEIPSRSWIEQVMDLDQEGGIDSIEFSPDGYWLASSHQGWTNLWDVQTFQLVGQPIGYRDPWRKSSFIAFNPVGDLLAATTHMGINFWSLNINDWEATACDMANRNLTLEEWKTYLGELPYRETCP